MHRQPRKFSEKDKPVRVEEISGNPINHSFPLQQTVAFEEQHFSSLLHAVPLKWKGIKKPR